MPPGCPRWDPIWEPHLGKSSRAVKRLSSEPQTSGLTTSSMPHWLWAFTSSWHYSASVSSSVQWVWTPACGGDHYTNTGGQGVQHSEWHRVDAHEMWTLLSAPLRVLELRVSPVTPQPGHLPPCWYTVLFLSETAAHQSPGTSVLNLHTAQARLWVTLYQLSGWPWRITTLCDSVSPPVSWMVWPR